MSGIARKIVQEVQAAVQEVEEALPKALKSGETHAKQEANEVAAAVDGAEHKVAATVSLPVVEHGLPKVHGPSAASVHDLFDHGRVPNASELSRYAEDQGWSPTQTATGPLKYWDGNGIERMTVKRGSARTPGSQNPHVALRNAEGKRVDPWGNEVGRDDLGNHTPIAWDGP